MSRVTIAVLSDLHCHAIVEPGGKKESFLNGSPRVPSNRHPIQALVDLSKKLNLRADVIVCPGDMANKISITGLNMAWDFLRNDIREAFNANHVFCTLGNHDVSSRSSGHSPFHYAQQLHPEFPFREEDDQNRYWTKGYCVQRVTDTDLLIINSTHAHYDEETAARGTFSHDQIVDLDNYLSQHTLAPIRVAVLHHHPVLHSIMHYPSTDVLPTGDELLNVLAKYKFSLVIHGHRHFPRIQRYISAGHAFHIFAAGSFSAYLDELGTRTRNVFHLINLDLDEPYRKGLIKTWQFAMGLGWNPASVPTTEFPHSVNIGIPPVSDIKERIIGLFSTAVDALSFNELAAGVPTFASLLPDEIVRLDDELKEDGLKLIFDECGCIDSIQKIYPFWSDHD